MSENGPTDGRLESSGSGICEVDYEVLKRGGLLVAKWRFVAWTSGPGGRRALARSTIVYGHTPEIQRALNAVIALEALARLVSGAGWSEVSRGERWYNLRFEQPREAQPGDLAGDLAD